MRKHFLQIVLLSIVSALCLEVYFSNQFHTLTKSADWYSIKNLTSRYFMGLMGSNEYLQERQALAGGQLNLSKWFGHHQLLYKNELKNLSELEIYFKYANPQSYMLVSFVCDAVNCLTYRAGAGSQHPSAFLTIDDDGKFSDVQIAENQGIRATETNTDHVLKITYSEGVATAAVDSDEPARINFKGVEFPLILSSGYHDVSVSEIQARTTDGQKIKINFTIEFKFFRFLSIFGMLAWFLVLAYYFFRHTKHPDLALQFGVFVFSFSALIMIADYFFLNRRYYSWEARAISEGSFSSFAQAFETKRKALFNTYDYDGKYKKFIDQPVWFSRVENNRLPLGKDTHIDSLQLISKSGDIVFNSDIDVLLKNKLRDRADLKIAFLGGSQTWGAGAVRPQNSFPSLVVTAMSSKGKRSTVGLNFSRIGAGVTYFESQLEALNKFSPDLVIMNFGGNDAYMPDNEFIRSLDSIFKFLSENKIKVLVTLEPMNPEFSTAAWTDEDLRKAPLIRQVAEKYSLDAASMNKYFFGESVQSQGLIWHDIIHFTNLGHRLAADFLLKQPQLIELMKK